MGLIKAPPVDVGVISSLAQDGGGGREEMTSLPTSARARSELVFTIELADGVVVKWRCTMRDNNLFVHVPVNLPEYGSKDR